MRPTLPLSLLPLLALLPSSLAQNQNIPTYFVISTPARGTVWSNNATNLVQWDAAVDEVPAGIFDVELARLSTDGLLFVARNVPVNWNALNIELDAVPNGDDYFLMFLDAQHGISYSTSQRFSIQVSNGTVPSVDSSKPTATIAGPPNPTADFGTTFAAAPNGAVGRMAMAHPGWVGAGLAALSLVVTL